MEKDKLKIGTIGWIDLTIQDAKQVKEFYSAVVGWESAEVKMDGYSDYMMTQAGTDNPIAGVCHKGGVNKDIPSGWMIYITVEDLDKSIEQVKKMGGEILAGPKNYGSEARYCIIKDPSGSVCALYAEN